MLITRKRNVVDQQQLLICETIKAATVTQTHLWIVAIDCNCSGSRHEAGRASSSLQVYAAFIKCKVNCGASRKLNANCEFLLLNCPQICNFSRIGMCMSYVASCVCFFETHLRLYKLMPPHHHMWVCACVCVKVDFFSGLVCGVRVSEINLCASKSCQKCVH